MSCVMEVRDNFFRQLPRDRYCDFDNFILVCRELDVIAVFEIVTKTVYDAEEELDNPLLIHYDIGNALFYGCFQFQVLLLEDVLKEFRIDDFRKENYGTDD